MIVKNKYSLGNRGMFLQVLVTTMNGDERQLINEMNLENSEVVIANQNGKNEIQEWEQSNGKKVICVSSDTKGASINRNIAIKNSSADILVFADDDQRFLNDFEEIVRREFNNHYYAQAIKFYCESTNLERPLSFPRPATFKKINFMNGMSAGIHAFAIKRSVLINKNIMFPEDIGPGTKYYLGEDSVFIKKIIDSGINVYLSPKLISYVKQDGSSWFNGYTEHYFVSIGYVYGRIYGKIANLYIIRRALKLRRQIGNPFSVIEMIKFMRYGLMEFMKK